MKYKRLYAEMFVKGITKKDLAELLSKSERAISNRINGTTAFTVSEVKKIANSYFRGYSVDALFFSGKDK